MKNTLKPICKSPFIATAIVFLLGLISLTGKAQNAAGEFIVNDQPVPEATILELEKKYSVKCIPGNYWYDKMTGAFGTKGGPCIGVGIPGLTIGGPLQSNASAGNTGVFINGRELHTLDVLVLKTLGPVIPGRYWMDAYGNFGYENYPLALGNLYQLYWSKNGGYDNKPKSPATGDIGGLVSDGTSSGYFVKKADGTTIEYYR